MEEFILALVSRGVKVGNLLTGELTMGNYLRKRIRGESGMHYRRHPEIRMIDNLCVHPLPLRWSRDIKARRRSNILAKAHAQVKAYIEEEGTPDFIFHHGIFDYTYITRFLSVRFGIPYWFKEHSSQIEADRLPCNNDFETPESLREFVRGAHARFAPSAAYCHKLANIFGAPFDLMYNYLNDGYYALPLAPRKEKPFIFLNVAVMTPVKNQQLILRAFAKALKDQELDARLIIAGDGTLRDQLQDLANELRISEKVEILTFQNRNAIRTLFDRSHAFVLSSQLETFGLVLVEAMSRGIPVISSRIPGPVSLVNDKNGLLFEPGDSDDLAKTMCEMMDTYSRYDRHAIREAARFQFGPDHLIEVLTKYHTFTGAENKATAPLPP